jgi:hypothetical protein
MTGTGGPSTGVIITGGHSGTATTSASIAQDGNHAERVNVNAIRRTDLWRGIKYGGRKNPFFCSQRSP